MGAVSDLVTDCRMADLTTLSVTELAVALLVVSRIDLTLASFNVEPFAWSEAREADIRAELVRRATSVVV